MKKITLLLIGIAIIISISLISQTPQAFKYQTVVRNGEGVVVANQMVGFEISIHDSIPAGAKVYQETHTTEANEFGLVTLEIGNGDSSPGEWTAIDWSTNDKFLEVAVDITGGDQYVSLGTTQLLAVPYALYSETTGDTTQWRKMNNDLFYTEGKVGIGTTSPSVRLDLRSSVTDDHGRLWLGNSDLSHYLRLFSGRQNSPNPGILWNETDALRFGTSLNSFTEYMRITNTGMVGIGTASPDPSAKLDVSSDSLGFLLPRMTVTELVAINNPANGLLVFNETDGKLYIYIEILGEWKQINYGLNSISESCGFPITDSSDMQIYNTVQIGTQCWMAENLNIGTRIDGVIEQTNNVDIEKYCYNDEEDSCGVYGGLYMWDEMMQYSTTPGVQGICPDGWHIPSDEEWKYLEGTVDSSYPIGDPVWDIMGPRGYDAGGNLKEPGYVHWNSPNTGTNTSGFTALASGAFSSVGNLFAEQGYLTFFYTSTQYATDYAIARILTNDSNQIERGYADPDELATSVRCLKD